MTPPQFERLKGEKAEQWQAFKIYRDMGSIAVILHILSG